ncbi:MAG: flagellar motor protein MotB [Phycisphaeraceae bacterium]
MHKQTFPLMAAGLLAAMLLAGCQTGQADRLWQENAELRSESERTLEALDQTQMELRATEADLEAARTELEDVRSQLEDQPDQPAAAPRANTGFSAIEGVETVRAAGGDLAVRVPGDVLFGPGSAELKGTAKRTLAEIAGVLQRDYPASRIRVEGHTDTDPIRKSKWSDNLELSLHRAAAVERHLAEQGVDADRIYAAGFGESDPRATKAKSRRVEIVVIGG